MSARATIMLVSVAALPKVFTIADLLAHEKANPGNLHCGTAGSGGITHIVCAALSSAMGIPITPVHYKGVSQGQIDLIAGRTQLSAGTLFNALPNLKTGKLRAIATLNQERSKLLPDLKTSYEQGVDVEFPAWQGVMAPAKTPPAIVAKLQQEFHKAIHAPDTVKLLDAQGLVPVASTPEAFRAKIISELARQKRIIVERNIKAEE
jgi:tripartite-type tricarboxylate transporter receptor subunit TctC